MFLKALREVAQWKMEGGELTLLDAQGAPLAQFVAQPPKR